MFLVEKPGTRDYRPVQDSREVNKKIEFIYPTVPNPYTLLGLLPLEHKVYTEMDSKDTLFSIPLSKLSQPILTFEWTDPELGISESKPGPDCLKVQNSLTIFSGALNQELSLFSSKYPKVILL